MRSHRLWRALSERRGEGYVDVIVLVLCAVMVLALAMRVPVSYTHLTLPTTSRV